VSSSVQLAAKALRTALLLGAIVTVAIAVVGGGIGFALVGPIGVSSALVGSAMAFVFMGITAGSILIGQNATGGSIASGLFFGIVLGAWLLKFVLFLVAAFAIRNSDSFDTVIAFSCVIAAVLGALVSDVIAISRARVPIVDMV
jgi:hypothetical protein